MLYSLYLYTGRTLMQCRTKDSLNVDRNLHSLKYFLCFHFHPSCKRTLLEIDFSLFECGTCYWIFAFVAGIQVKPINKNQIKVTRNDNKYAFPCAQQTTDPAPSFSGIACYHDRCWCHL